MRLSAWVDGGSRGNPGPAGYGVFLRDEAGTVRLREWGYIGTTTNNVAEYRALISALEAALSFGATMLEVRTDSELMQRQLTGVYKVRQPHLQELARTALDLAKRLREFKILHVRREENRIADALANRAMDERGSGREVDPPGKE
jgi:ribonuclease HI